MVTREINFYFMVWYNISHAAAFFILDDVYFVVFGMESDVV